MRKFLSELIELLNLLFNDSSKNYYSKGYNDAKKQLLITHDKNIVQKQKMIDNFKSPSVN